MKPELIFGGIVAALFAYFIYESTQGSGNGSSTSGVTIPALLAPVATDQSCTSKTDAQGNWYGVDVSGNCTIEALGGAGGSY